MKGKSLRSIPNPEILTSARNGFTPIGIQHDIKESISIKLTRSIEVENINLFK